MNRNANTKRLLAGLMAVACAATTLTAHAQSATVVYPAKGQSARQQDKDKYDCYAWARAQSGFDPAQASASAGGAPPTPTAAPGGMLRGAMGGAAIAGLTDHDAGQGAAAGALGAAVRQRVKAQQAAQQQQAAQGQQRATYDRAYRACLEGRGYTVK